MTFWETEGVNVQQSQIKKLLQENATLEQLMNEETFLDEFNTQLPELVNFLKREENLQTLIKYTYSIEPIVNCDFKQSAKYSYIGFRVLSECNPKINQVLYNSQFLMDNLFSVISSDPQKYITPQGYFQSIVRNNLNSQNTEQEKFLQLLQNNYENKVFSLVRNLSKANAETIRDILSCRSESCKLLQNLLFEFLLCYFLNEEFLQNKYQILDINENFCGIFDFLIFQDFKYFFKKQYVKNLLQPSAQQDTQLAEDIFFQKLSVLHYVAHTDQYDNSVKFSLLITQLKQYKDTRKFRFYIIKFCKILQILTQKVDFNEQLDHMFFQDMLNFMVSVPQSDIIHQGILTIFKNCKIQINSDNNIYQLLQDFFVQNIKECQWEQNKKKYHNDKISANTLYEIISILDSEKLNSEAKSWIEKLSKIFTTLQLDQHVQDIMNMPKENLVVNIDLNFDDNIQLKLEGDQKKSYINQNDNQLIVQGENLEDAFSGFDFN